MKFETKKFLVVVVTYFVPGNAKSQESVLCMLISCIRITKRPNIFTLSLIGTGVLRCVSARIESKTVLTGNCTSQAQWRNWCSKGQALQSHESHDAWHWTNIKINRAQEYSSRLQSRVRLGSGRTAILPFSTLVVFCSDVLNMSLLPPCMMLRTVQCTFVSVKIF